MGLRHLAFACLSVACIASNAVSSAPTSAPTRATDVDAYLDVALDAITNWKGPAANQSFAMPNMHVSAAMLVYARGNELDVAQARRLIDLDPQQSPKSTPEARASDRAFGRLALAAAIGDTKRAESFFEDYAKLHHDSPILGDGILSVAEGLIGRDDDCVSSIDDASPVLASTLAEANRLAVVKRLRANFKPAADTYGTGTERWAEIDCAYGRFDDALAMIDSIRRTDIRVRAFVDLASRLDEMNRHDEAERALKKAIAAWDHQPADENPIYVNLDAAIDGGHTELARQMYSRMLRQMRDADRQWASTWRWVGLDGFGLGDLKQLDAAIDAIRPIAVAALKEQADADPNSSQKSDAGYVLAALLMTAGRQDEAMEEYKRTRARFPDEDLSVSEGFPHLTRAMMSVGRTREALDLAASVFPREDDLDFELVAATKSFLDRADVQSAWATAGRFKRLWNLQFRCRLMVLLHLEHNGQRSAAIKLLQEMPSPTERAGLAIMVARDLQGTRLLGMGRLSFQ